MNRWLSASLVALSLLLTIALTVPRAEGIVLAGFFTDDNGNTFEDDIDAIAAAGITRGCNPPTNDRYCPNDQVTRGQMAAFLRRALELPNSNTNFFTDDNGNTFEDDIDAIAAAGITRGCNPPTNDRYCPNDQVTRGQMAAFLRRALDLPAIVQTIPVGDHPAMVCAKDGETCSLTVDVSAGRSYRVREGLFLADSPTAAEEAAFNAQNTSFALTLDGSDVQVAEVGAVTGDGTTSRYWSREITFGAGTHTLVGRWRWNGTLIQTNTLTIRASN